MAQGGDFNRAQPLVAGRRSASSTHHFCAFCAAPDGDIGGDRDSTHGRGSYTAFRNEPSCARSNRMIDPRKPWAWALAIGLGIVTMFVVETGLRTQPYSRVEIIAEGVGLAVMF